MKEEKINLIILNNKCNFKKKEYEEYLSSLEKYIEKKSTAKKVILCPSTCYLCYKKSEKIILGSQNVSMEEMGSHTGEVAASQLYSIGVKYTIIGHQELRRFHNEDNQVINKKIKQLLKNNIIPILCVGEIEKEKKEVILEKIKKDIKEAVVNIEKEEQEKIILAYEPAWAIGGNITDDLEKIEEMIKEFKNYLPNNKIIYGGGVNLENIKYLKEISEIEGFLLGSISLDVSMINRLLQELET